MSLRLLDNEQIMCTLKKTSLIWITPILLWFFSLMFYSAYQRPEHQGILWFISFVLLFVCIIEIIKRYRYAWYVTNKRLILHYWLFLHEREMRFEQLEWVNVQRYKAIFWHQINVIWTWGTTTLFDYVSNYNEFKIAIYDAKEKLKPTNI